MVSGPPDAAAARTALLTRAVWRHLVALGWQAVPEMPLPDGRRADLFAVDAAGGLIIVEVKSGLADFRADLKWGEYLAWADSLYFAVPTDFPLELLPDSAGIVLADGFGAEIVRSPTEARLPAARRRALVLRMARHAAARVYRAAETSGPQTAINPTGFIGC